MRRATDLVVTIEETLQRVFGCTHHPETRIEEESELRDREISRNSGHISRLGLAVPKAENWCHQASIEEDD